MLSSPNCKYLIKHVSFGTNCHQRTLSVACPASVEFDRVSADDSDGVGVPDALVFLAGAGGVGRVVATVGQWTRLADEVRCQRIYATQAHIFKRYFIYY